MKYEPMAKFECDNCDEYVVLELQWIYTDYSGKNGYYTEEATRETPSLETTLQTEWGWEIVKTKHEDTLHSCPECAEVAKGGQ